MNSLLRFIEKYQFFLLFLALELFSIWLLSTHTYYQRSKFEDIVRSVTGYTNAKITKASQYIMLAKANDLLTRENIDLKSQLAKLSARLELTNVVSDSAEQSQYSYVTARVINNSVNKQYNYITLNIGSNDGVEREMGVITNNGVVGIVAGVSEHYSTIISLLNTDLKISAKLKKSHHFGSLYWDGTNYKEVVLSDIPQHVPISIGDTVVTSGFSSIFPTDINLGVIKTFDSKGANFYHIKVTLFTDFKQLHTVWLAKNRFANEREILETQTSSN